MAIWLWVLAAVVVIATWIIFWFLPLPLVIAIGITVLVVLTVVGIFVFRRIRASQRAAALERELLKQAAQQADHARPDRRPEILALQARMKEAIDALKRSKLGARGSGALYALPWYVIVGPPAAGKTTALEQSGLAFTAPGAAGPRIKGTAGTKNCEWWFSQDAILLDTAGRFATEEDDRDEWFAFLDTVKRFRPRKPLEGIIVALSVADLMNAGDAQIEEMAAKLRARTDEVMNRLEMVLPIYVMFTKVDLVAGFVEFWADLTKPERARAWGATFPLEDERLAEPAAAFELEFDQLVQVLHARMIERLAGERLPEARARLLQFAVEFQSLRSSLSHFVEELCRVNPYQETPILRGFYFTSGTQVGRPIDRVLSNMLRGFSLRGGAGRERPAAEKPQSYFVTELFKQIIFPDRHIAMRSSNRLRRGLRRQTIYAIVALFVTIGVVVPAALSYVDNLDLVHATSRDVAEAARVERGRTAAASTDSLGVLTDRIDLLERSKSALRIPGWIGSRTAPPLYEATRALYLRKLRSTVDGPVKDQVTADVRAVGDLMRTDAQNFESAYNDLKLYVMLLTAPEYLDPEWATARLGEEWEQSLRAATNVDSDRIKVHAKNYVDALAVDPSWRWQADEQALSRARGALLRQPLEQLQYSWLISSARGVPAIKAQKVITGPAAQYIVARPGVEVPGPYTKPGWEKVREALKTSGTRIVVEPWVLGGTPQDLSDVRKTSADLLRKMYFERYVRAWYDFFAGFDVQTPTDIRSAIDELASLTEPRGPHETLFRALVDNARLDLEAPSLLGKLLQKGAQAVASATAELTGVDAGPQERAISPVEREFEPLLRFAEGDSSGGRADGSAALRQYISELRKLDVSLTQLRESRTEPTAQFESELARTATAVEALLGAAGFDAAMRHVLEPLFMNPIRGSRAGVVSTAFSYLNDKWKAEVWETWNGKIAGRYPFSDGTEGDVTIGEFVEFFRPGMGTIWKFFDKNLQDKLERTGNQFAPRPSADSVPFLGEFLGCLNRAQEITDAIFGGGSEALVPFFLKIESVNSDISDITFTVDGKAISYQNGPEKWLTAEWPGKGPSKGAMLEVRGTSGFVDRIPRAGDFGLFRLLSWGGLKSLSSAGHDSGPVLLATWALSRAGEPPVKIQLRPAKSVHPFVPGFFHMKCPPAITLHSATVGAAAREP